MQASGGGVETHRVTWVGGYYWVLALQPRVVVPPGASNPGDPALGGPLEPPGPRSYDELQAMTEVPRALYQETHASACARVGLVPSSEHVSLRLPPDAGPGGGIAVQQQALENPNDASQRAAWGVQYAQAIA